MTCQDNELLLNDVLIQMARSFLQYAAESSPWVRLESSSLEGQLYALAARQRQDVGDVVELLAQREHYIDFGSFPTEYTDLQFLALSNLIARLRHSQTLVCSRIASAAESLRTAGDTEGAELLAGVEAHERDILRSLAEVEKDLASSAASA